MNNHKYETLIGVSIFVVGIIVFLALLIGGIVGTVYYLDKRACSTRAKELGLDWKYRMVGGCFVGLPSGRYVNLANIRFTEQGKILVEP